MSILLSIPTKDANFWKFHQNRRLFIDVMNWLIQTRMLHIFFSKHADMKNNICSKNDQIMTMKHDQTKMYSVNHNSRLHTYWLEWHTSQFPHFQLLPWGNDFEGSKPDCHYYYCRFLFHYRLMKNSSNSWF